MRHIRSLSMLCAILLALGLFSGCRSSSGSREIRAAYPSRSAEGGDMFGYESREVIAYSDERLCTLALQIAMSEPMSEELYCIFPDRTMLRSVAISGHGVVTIHLSEEYSSLSHMERTIADYCMTLTLYALSEELSFSISGVIITVEGEDTRTLRTPDDIVESTDQLRLREHEFTIYFPVESLGKLLPSTFRRTLSDSEEPAEVIMEILLDGVQENGMNTPIVSYDAILHSVEVYNRVCYLDWNEAFIDLSLSGSDTQILNLYAIVNSLCELSYIDRVQFLINGEAVPSVLYPDFDEPYEPQESLILGT